MIRHVIITLAATLIIVPAHAGEVLESYRPHMRTASDWSQINWYDQAQIAMELGDSFINACMDMASTDIRYKRIPFENALSQCQQMAKDKNK